MQKKNCSNIGQIYLITMQRTKNSEINIFGLYIFSYTFFLYQYLRCLSYAYDIDFKI